MFEDYDSKFLRQRDIPLIESPFSFGNKLAMLLQEEITFQGVLSLLDDPRHNVNIPTNIYKPRFAAMVVQVIRNPQWAVITPFFE